MEPKYNNESRVFGVKILIISIVIIIVSVVSYWLSFEMFKIAINLYDRYIKSYRQDFSFNFTISLYYTYWFIYVFPLVNVSLILIKNKLLNCAVVIGIYIFGIVWWWFPLLDNYPHRGKLLLGTITMFYIIDILIILFCKKRILK